MHLTLKKPFQIKAPIEADVMEITGFTLQCNQVGDAPPHIKFNVFEGLSQPDHTETHRETGEVRTVPTPPLNVGNLTVTITLEDMWAAQDPPAVELETILRWCYGELRSRGFAPETGGDLTPDTGAPPDNTENRPARRRKKAGTG